MYVLVVENASCSNIQGKSQLNISVRKLETTENLNRNEKAVNDKLILILHKVKEVKSELEFVKNQLQLIQNTQEKISGNTLENSCVSISQITNKYGYSIPFETVKEFKIFDSALKDDEMLSKDVNSILQTGLDSSLSLSKSIVNIFKMFLSKHVAIQYVSIKKK